MTHEEAVVILDKALDQIGEHFDAVQILVSWMDEGRSTKSLNRGSGNFYARESLARAFVRKNEADDMACVMAAEMRKDG